MRRCRFCFFSGAISRRVLFFVALEGCRRTLIFFLLNFLPLTTQGRSPPLSLNETFERFPQAIPPAGVGPLPSPFRCCQPFLNRYGQGVLFPAMSLFFFFFLLFLPGRLPPSWSVPGQRLSPFFFSACRVRQVFFLTLGD